MRALFDLRIIRDKFLRYFCKFRKRVNMILNAKNLKNNEEWLKKNYVLPNFDLEKVTLETSKSPTWLHLGAGNIFRALPANLNQILLDKGLVNTGIIVGEGFDFEIIQKAFKPYDNLTLLVTLKADGTVDKKVIGSIVESLEMNSENTKDFARLKEIFQNDSLQMVSFTITEKGYSLVDGRGDLIQEVTEDFKNGPEKPKSYMGKLTSLIYTRYQNGATPLALVSMDNVSHNGTLLREAVMRFASEWVDNDKVDGDFKAYVENPQKISFPWSMIDKITPRPDETVKKMLEEDGFEDTDLIITSKNTYISPFVNAEEAEYLVIEDAFPNGRPPLEKAGVYFTDRATVDKAEMMKVTTSLNPLHTALAIYGRLLGYSFIHEEMEDPELNALVKKIGYNEGLPVVVDPGIIDPKEFIDEVINVRFPNPFMPDTPQRIATDTSQKLAIRFGKTIKSYVESDELNVTELEYIPLVLAGWLRYLMGVSDTGDTFELSPDPLLKELTTHIAEIKLGEIDGVEEKIRPILERQEIFGVDLYKIGLADKVIADFKELIAGEGAIRKTLIQKLKTY